jgi:hypothetical protein
VLFQLQRSLQKGFSTLSSFKTKTQVNETFNLFLKFWLKVILVFVSEDDFLNH